MSRTLRETWPLMAVSFLLLLLLDVVDDFGGLGHYGFSAIMPWVSLCDSPGLPDGMRFVQFALLPSLVLQFPIYIVYLYKAHSSGRLWPAFTLVALLHFSAFAAHLGVTHWDDQYCRAMGIVRVITR